MIETEDVLGVENNIGGTYHSKVGLVSQGLGHIGTMLGPNFSGHSLIAIHNVSKEVLTIKVGDTFVSAVFNYLNTAIYTNNATKNGYLEKLSELGIQLNTIDRKFLDCVGHLFQSRYNAEIIEEDNYLLEVSIYIHLNPVKAKMVKKPEFYKWSSYSMYIVSEKEKLICSDKILSYFKNNRDLYKNMLSLLSIH